MSADSDRARNVLIDEIQELRRGRESLLGQIRGLTAKVEREAESYQRALRDEYGKREALDARVVELEKVAKQALALLEEVFDKREALKRG